MKTYDCDRKELDKILSCIKINLYHDIVKKYTNN